jgi:hypothetical protein
MYKFDCFGSNINLTFRNSTTSKTCFGALLSIIASAFSIFAIYYFGMDIISKSKPISRFSKELQEESKIPFKEFPVMMQFVNPLNEVIEELDRYIVFRPILYSITLNKDTGKQNFELSYLFIEKCDADKHFFGVYKEFVMDRKNNFPTDTSWCLNPRKIQYSNGTVEERDDLYFMNEWGGTHAKFFTAFFDICKSEKYPERNCKPIEEIKNVFSEVYNQIYFVDKFINLSNYTNPYSMYTYTFATQMVYGSTKSNFFRIKNIEIETDYGYVLEEIKKTYSFQLDSIRNDMSINEDMIMMLTLESPKLSDRYYRRYVKVQDLVANVGGLIKSIFLIGSFICEYYSNSFLYFYISNKLITINKNNYHYEKIELKSINTSAKKDFTKILSVSNSYITNNPHIPKINNYIPENCENQKLGIMRKVDLSFHDYLKAKLCKKSSKFKSEQYRLIVNFIKKQFDVLYIINQFMNIIKMKNLFINEKNKDYLNMKTNIEQIETKYLEHADDFVVRQVNKS